MANNDTSNGPSRPRAPTITIDTSATNDPTMGDSVPLAHIQDNNRPATYSNNDNVSPTQTRQHSQDLHTAHSFDSKESRPTSPHNISSPATAASTNAGLLSVPGARSRGNSVDSATENGESNSTGTYVASSQGDTVKGDLGPTEILNDKDALKPDPGTEADFEVENNKFAFSPGQLGKLYNPKSVSCHALTDFESTLT
jgi:Ca2+-transporting ATPase